MNATDQELVQQLGAQDAHTMMARSFPAGLGWADNPETWMFPRHLQLINSKLVEACQGNKRIIVSLPPRSGKSFLISQYFPAWYLGTHPDNNLLLGTYGANFAKAWGRKCRDILNRHAAKFGINGIRRDVSAAGEWEVAERKGGMLSVGVGGEATGRGGQMLLLDDPIKNAEQARSKKIRDKIDDWFQSTYYTRREPGASIIVVATRWSEDDLIGRLLRRAADGGEQWEYIALPAIAGYDDPIGREPGEPLWPERYSVEDLAQIRKAVGEYWWSALYLQSPSPLEGGIFKRHWWKFYKQAPPKFDAMFFSWDFAVKAEQENDYTVGQVWGILGANRYLVHQVRIKAEFIEALRAVSNMISQYRQFNGILVEDSALGPAVVSTLKQTYAGIIPVKAQGGKEMRASAASPQVESGNVLLPDPSLPGAEWVEEFLAEHSSFPNAANDDQVDATSQFLNYIGCSRGGDQIVGDVGRKEQRHLSMETKQVLSMLR